MEAKDQLERLYSAEPRSMSAAELASFNRLLRRVEAKLASLRNKVATRAHELAVTGEVDSAAALLEGRGEVSAATARNEANRAPVLAKLPHLAAGLAKGSVSPEHVDVVVRAHKRLDDDARDHLISMDAELASKSANASVGQLSRAIGRALRAYRPDVEQSVHDRQVAESQIRLWIGHDGMGRMSAQIDRVRFDSLCEMLDAERQSMAANGQRAFDDQLTIDALLALMERGSSLLRPGQAARPSVTIIIDHQTATTGPQTDGVCETAAGAIVPPETARRLCCDADVTTVRLDNDGAPIDVGRKSRTATIKQWAALKAIYRTCGWAGCDRPINWCQAHHIKHWEDFGRTDMANLVPLCSHHHHQVHEGGWRIQLDKDRTLHIQRPDGTPWAEASPDRCRTSESLTLMA